MAALRIGNNRFFRSSWHCLLEPLSSHPPRELDLSFASVLPRRSPAHAVADGDGGSRTAGQGTPPCSVAIAGEPFGEVSPLFSSQQLRAQEQSLGELLASMVLPVDSPGIETLNLTRSTGLLLDDCQHDKEVAGRGARDGEQLLRRSSSSSSSTAAFLMLLRDALVSPLCRTTHLLLSGVRGSPPLRPEAAFAAAASRNAESFSSSAPGGRGRMLRVFRPHEAKSLCEAASACASLRCLDLAGCDLSGPVGAVAAVSAVACLIRSGDGDGSDDGAAVFGFSVDPASSCLRRLSLRACGLGASGLSAVMRALVALPGEDRALGGEEQRWGGSLPRFPRLLDLSDNRPLAAAAIAAASAAVGTVNRDSGGVQAGTAAVGEEGEEGDVDALSDLAASVHALEREGLASVVISCDPRRSHRRYTICIPPTG